MTTRMHIAMLSIHSSPLGKLGARDTGGMSVYVRELGRRLGEKGHRVDIFTARTIPEKQHSLWLAEGVRLIHIGESLADSNEGFADGVIDWNTLASWIEQFRLAQEIGYSLIHSNYWLSGVLGVQLATTWNCPHVMTFHTLAHAKKESSAGHEEHEQRLAAEKNLTQNCTTVLAPTRIELNRLFGINGKKTTRIRMLGCGVDLERFRPLPSVEENFAKNSIDLLFVGRFDAMKGLPDLLQSLAFLKRENIELCLGLIGGDGTGSPVWHELSHQAEALELADNVVFYGRVAHELLPKYYNSATVVVLPSHYESFGLVTLEALACGIPVAATRVGIAADVIIPGVNGYLAEPQEPKSLAKAIISTLTLAAVTSSSKIRQTVKGYGWQNVADELEGVYYNNLNTFHI